MKIRYLKDVDSPRAQAGKTGDVRDVEKWTAKQLIKGGYAVKDGDPDPPKPKEPNVLIKEQSDGDIDKGPDSQGGGSQTGKRKRT